MKVRIILKKDYPNLGKKDEVKIVKMGYAKNFLLPKKIAVLATPENIRLLKQKLEKQQKEKQKELKKLEELQKLIENKTFEILKKAKKDGSLYAQVSKLDVIKAIKNTLKNKKIELEKQKIELPQKIKKIGEYEAFVKLSKDKNIKIILSIKKE